MCPDEDSLCGIRTIRRFSETLIQPYVRTYAQTGNELYFTTSFDADIDTTLSSSSKNSAPKIHSSPFSLFVITKLEQNSTELSFSVRSRNLRWLVPTITSEEVHVAVEIFIFVGSTGSLSRLTTLSCSKLLDAPVSTRQVTISSDGGNWTLIKNKFLPTLTLNSFSFLVVSSPCFLIYLIVASIYSACCEFSSVYLVVVFMLCLLHFKPSQNSFTYPQTLTETTVIPHRILRISLSYCKARGADIERVFNVRVWYFFLAKEPKNK